MNNIVARIAPASAPAYAGRALLGKPCRAYVEKALAEANIPLAPDTATLAEIKGTVLWIREDVACISSKTLTQLAEAAQCGRVAVLFTLDEQTALAAAMTTEALASLATDMPLSQLDALFSQAELPVSSEEYMPEALEECFAVQDATSYAAALRLLNARFVCQHMANGVILLDPERIMIDADVTIGAGTIVYAGNVLQGATQIGEGCTLYPNNRMQNAVIGDGVTVENSVLLDCSVGSHTTVGPFAYLRPKSSVGEHCRIGDFVEVKNSSIGNGTKVSHLTYVGDSDLGQGINLGCGVVFVNYDGKTKNRCTVEDHAFIGCNCNLVAPVRVGENAYLAAGSTVVEDVPADSLFVARARGSVKEDWVKRRKEQGKL